jgi:Tfp pilus assembly protein PilX
MLNNQRGSSLLIVLIVIVVLSILGGVLLNILVLDNKGNALVVAKTRAELIANAGIDEVVALVREAVSRGSSAVSDKDSDARVKRAQEIITNIQLLESYDDRFTVNDDTSAIEYDVDIRNKVASRPSITRPQSSYVHIVEITVKATVDTPISTSFTSEKTIYVSDISPLFRYVLSSSPAGQIQINGSPTIVGDGLINDNLSFSNTVSYTNDKFETFTLDSILPFWRGFLKNRSSNTDPLTYQSRFAWPQPYLERAKLKGWDERPFDLGSTINKGIVGQKIDEAQSLNGTLQPVSTDLYGTDLGTNAPSRDGCSVRCGADLLSGDTRFREWVTIWGNNSVDDRDLLVDGNLIINDESSDGASLRMENNPRLIIRNGSLFVRNIESNFSAADLSGEIVMVDKNNQPTIDASIIIQGKATLTNFTFNGSMFVQGDVKIIGDLNMTGVLYVTGSVDLKEMRSINPPIEDTSKDIGNPLIIAANGPINLYSYRNQSADFDDDSKPIRIRAFLYSNSDVELYGVVSKYQIIGGVYGRNVTLNALRGEFSSFPKPGLQQSSSGYYFEDQSNPRFVRNEDARLQLSYDPRLFTNPPYGIPWVDSVYVYD